jgi:hypothetical protein
MTEPTFIDARQWEATERRAALVHIDGEAVMFTASWGRASSLVPRPDGAYRRMLLVRLEVGSEHRARCFHRVRFITLFALGTRESLSTDDLDGVHSRDLNSVTLTLFIDLWH